MAGAIALKFFDESAREGIAVIKIYGVVPTRTARSLWMLEEVGQPYQLVEVQPRTEQVNTPEYEAVNPS